MKFIEQSDTRLAFAIGLPYFNATQCDFDRTTGRAKIRRVMMFWRLKPIDLALDEIVSIQLGGGYSAQSDQYYKIYPMIVLESGRTISCGAVRESSSKEAVAAMKSFLKIA